MPVVLVVLAAAGAAGYLLAFVLDRLVRRAERRSHIAADVSRRGRRPLRLTAVLLGLLIAANATPSQHWTPPLVRVLGLALIAGFAWLATVGAFVLEDLALARYRTDMADNRHARRVRTQITLLRRITTAVVTLIAIAAMLMTFPSVRVAGASIFASAGVVGIVAGLAAQTSLANVFAGLQLAFTDAIRVDDVVVVEDEWGRIEEITLTYVVVHIWDDRRMILPSTYFTTTPFQNWTRRESAVLGAVELDLDWSVPTEDLRTQLHAILAGTDLWDGRVAVLQVTDAVAGYVRVRVLVSGKDGPTLPGPRGAGPLAARAQSDGAATHPRRGAGLPDQVGRARPMAGQRRRRRTAARRAGRRRGGPRSGRRPRRDAPAPGRGRRQRQAPVRRRRRVAAAVA
jgi:protein-S-isoprenylcysteine O-methyltransferase Ste14